MTEEKNSDKTKQKQSKLPSEYPEPKFTTKTLRETKADKPAKISRV